VKKKGSRGKRKRASLNILGEDRSLEKRAMKLIACEEEDCVIAKKRDNIHCVEKAKVKFCGSRHKARGKISESSSLLS